MTFQTSMDALTADAGRWRTIAGELSTASDAAGDLGLAQSQFSFAGDTVAQTYESLRAHVQEVLSGGEGKLLDAAGELESVRDTYQGTDEAAKARLDGTWNWT